jgi:hypothetical protein
MWLYGRHVGQLLGPKNGITAKFDAKCALERLALHMGF